MKIKDNCPECNPRSYAVSTLSFVDEIDEETNLYQCDVCNAKIWIMKKPSTIK